MLTYREVEDLFEQNNEYKSDFEYILANRDGCEIVHEKPLYTEDLRYYYCDAIVRIAFDTFVRVRHQYSRAGSDDFMHLDTEIAIVEPKTRTIKELYYE